MPRVTAEAAAKFVSLSSLIDDHFIDSEPGDEDLRDVRKSQAGKLQQTVRWFSMFLERPSTVADLDPKRFVAFYRFLHGQGLVQATIQQHRRALQTIWEFAADNSLATPCPNLSPVPSDLTPRRPKGSKPGTLDFFLQHSYVPSGGRRLSDDKRKKFKYVLRLWNLFHGRPPAIAEITPRHLDQFRDFVGRQPRHTYSCAPTYVRLIRELLHAAQPQKWPEVRRKNAAANRRPPAAGTLRHFFEVEYVSLRLIGASDNTISDYRTRLQVFERFAGDLPIEEIDDETLSGFLQDRLKHGAARDTVNGYRRVLVAILALARKRGHTRYEPCVSALRSIKRDPECWSLAEMQAILQAAAATPGKVGEVEAGKWWVALILFVYNCGTRISATMSIPSDCLDLQRGFVRVPAEIQKTKKEQRLDLMKETVNALRAIAPSRNERIFDDWPYDRTQVQFKALNNGLKDILRRAGLTASRRDLWHKIRRTFATMATITAGKAYASEMLGHSSLKTVEAYLDKRFLDRPSLRDVLPSIVADGKDGAE